MLFRSQKDSEIVIHDELEVQLDIYGLVPHIRNSGSVSFDIDGCALNLDLSFHHERLYACKLLLNVQYPQADIDTMLISRLIQKDDIVLDAGANIGFTALEFTLAGAAMVVAVEPVDAIYQRLSKLNHRRIFALCSAISSKNGTQDILISNSHNQGSTLKAEIKDIFPSIFGEHPSYEKVTVTTIDELSEQYQPFDVWKLDIEGAEADALLGAQISLKKHPPRLIIAELYGKFYAEFLELVAPTHPFSYRAFIRHEDYKLVLMPSNTEADSDKYCHHSPMYVFTRDELK